MLPASTRTVTMYGESVTCYSHPCSRLDEWVIEQTHGMHDGFFVEVGAFDGFRYSDTLTLERHYGWHGILVEPDPDMFRELRMNRRKCILCNQALAPYEIENDKFYRRGPLAGLAAYMKEPHYRTNDLITVSTIRLDTLLKAAPDSVDYLCLNVKGAEYDILSDYFTCHMNRHIRLLTVEFNNDYNKLRKLQQLLEPHGFELHFIRGWDACFRNLLML